MRDGALLALVALLLVPAAAAGPLLVGVVPDLPGAGPGDEGFAVAGAELAGLRVEDGEGAFTFPPGAVAGPEGLWVVGNLSAWRAHGGPEPVMEWTGHVDGPLRLGNGGDALRLVDAEGAERDAVAWGDGAAAGMEGAIGLSSPGLVLRRLADADGGWLDTDRAADWRTPRVHRIGESELDRPTFTVHRLTLYASPDSAFGVLRGLVEGAQERLHLHVYELRSAALADALAGARAARPGLDLQVLVEGNPVGEGDAARHATADALGRIEAAGGTVRLAGGGRYDYHHLKVLVADDAVAVQSENWVESGVPEDPSWGNRGWGVVVHDRAVADWFAAWMAADRAAWDTEPFEPAAFDPGFEAPPRRAPRSGAYGPIVAARTLDGEFTVMPVVSPDHTADPARDPVAGLAAAARARLWAEQLDLATTARNGLGWSAPDPLVAAVESASAAGADVRVLAAAPFSPGDAGNQAALDRLAASGVDARVLDRPGIATLHNKGFVADDAVVVGSMNGNHHSRSENREAGLVVRGPGVADFFAALFLADWEGTVAPRDGGVVADDLAGLGAAPWPTLLALLLVAGLLRRRA